MFSRQLIIFGLFGPGILSLNCQFSNWGKRKVGSPPLYSKTGWLKRSKPYEKFVQKHQVSKLKTTLESHRTKSDKVRLTLKKSLSLITHWIQQNHDFDLAHQKYFI